jgi:hypothetical protein
MESYPYKKHRGVGVLSSQLTSGAEHSPSESQAADARLSRHIDASANSSMLFGFWYPAMSRDLRAGAVARYIAHCGTKRVAKAVLIASTVGPHWMIMWPFDPMTTGLPTTHKPTGAYITWAGSPYAHVHIMGRP